MPLPTGLQQGLISATVTAVEGALVPAKLTAVQCAQGTSPTLQWTFLDPLGVQVDITDLVNLGHTAQLRVREALSLTTSNLGTTVNCTILNPPPGTPPCSTVQAVLPALATTYPGISMVEWAMINGQGVPDFTNLQYLIVNPGQFGTALSMNGPPSIPEIRLAIRDADPSGNLWLGTFEFDLAEIAWAIQRPISEWNEAAPPLDQQMNTASFPFRHNWLNAIAGYLLCTAGDWYSRVHLPYQAGGVAIDDKKKFEQYFQRGQQLLAEWRKFIQWKKVQINMDGGFSTLGSAYGNIGWW